MTYERLAKGASLLLLAATSVFAACSEDTPLSPKDNYCTKQCDCNKCTPEEKGTCLDDITNLEDEAREKDCKDQFNTYLTCLNNDAECTDGDYDTSVCFAEETDVNDCLKPPPPPCATTKNGVCDEPEGTNTCGEGTDVDDCKATPTCTTTMNGICDEPGGTGTGLCPTGTDVADCSPCPYANNGTCDEPEGSGLCVEGSDPNDCPTMACVSCYEYISTGTGLLCGNSEPIWMTFDTCACGTNCLSYCNICSGGVFDASCYSCMDTYCQGVADACQNDI